MDPWGDMFLLFVLVLLRIAGFMAFALFFGSLNVPTLFKAALSVAVTLLVFPSVLRRGAALPQGGGELVTFAALETLVGVVLGFVSSMVLIGIQLGAHVIGNKMGFSMANVIDPFTEAEVMLIEEFEFFLAVFVFLLVGGHQLLVSALVRSFDVVPVGGARLPDALWLELSRQFGGIFSLAIQTAAPVAGSMFLVTLGLGFLSRVVPQMNVMMLAFPVQIGAGVILLVVFMPVLVAQIWGAQLRMGWDLSAVTRLLAP